MAVSLLAHEISDLCLGKPALRSLAVSATVADALAALKSSEEAFISVWECNHSAESLGGGGHECRCIGKVSMVDVICYLCKDENLLSPSAAMKAPLSRILPNTPGLVTHLEPSSSLLDAIDLILEGAQNLIVPIPRRLSSNSRRKQQPKGGAGATATTTFHGGGREFCWLTQEDVVRFLLSSIGLFSPIPAISIDALGIISSDVLTTDYHAPAISAIDLISRSLADQTSVAVVDGDGALIGEISPFTLACCDETVSAAIATLSAGDLMAYIDGGGPPEDLVRVVKQRLKEKSLEGVLEDFSIGNQTTSFSSSSDEESSLSPTTTLARSSSSSRYGRSARMVRRAEAIVCHRKSSLVAVMIQAIAHRVNYVWVIEDDCGLTGIVTFSEILKVFREYTMA